MILIQTLPPYPEGLFMEISRIEKNILVALTNVSIYKKFVPLHHLAAYTSPKVVSWEKLEKTLPVMEKKGLIKTEKHKGAYGPWYCISGRGDNLINA